MSKETLCVKKGLWQFDIRRKAKLDGKTSFVVSVFRDNIPLDKKYLRREWMAMYFFDRPGYESKEAASEIQVSFGRGGKAEFDGAGLVYQFLRKKVKPAFWVYYLPDMFENAYQKACKHEKVDKLLFGDDNMQYKQDKGSNQE